MVDLKKITITAIVLNILLFLVLSIVLGLQLFAYYIRPIYTDNQFPPLTVLPIFILCILHLTAILCSMRYRLFGSLAVIILSSAICLPSISHNIFLSLLCFLAFITPAALFIICWHYSRTRRGFWPLKRGG